MNLDNLDILLHKPESIAANDANQLNEVLAEYPYFQSVRSLYLKSLYLQKSTEYNQELKKTAAYTLDRDILFEFIVSSDFVSYKPLQTAEETEPESIVENVEEIVQEEEVVIPPKETSTVIKSLLQSITILEHENEEDKINIEVKPTEDLITLAPAETPIEPETTIADDNNQENAEIEKLEEKLEIGKPLTFSENEKFSFQEWLQIAKTKPIDRENDPILTESEAKIDSDKQKKLDLIDKFIETNPKISPTKKPTSTPVNIENSIQENSSLMTETLAKIYLEQKKYQKAIQAYEILILKYPEKSSFFADQILDIKALQQHNN